MKNINVYSAKLVDGQLVREFEVFAKSVSAAWKLLEPYMTSNQVMLWKERTANASETHRGPWVEFRGGRPVYDPRGVPTAAGPGWIQRNRSAD